MLSPLALVFVLLMLSGAANSHKWSSNNDLQPARGWGPSHTLQQQRQQPPPVFLTSTHQPSDIRYKKDGQQRQQQKNDDSDNDVTQGNEVVANGRSFDGSKGNGDPSLSPSSLSPDHHHQPFRPFFNGYFNVQRFDPNFSSYPEFPKFGPGYRKDKYGHGYGYSCKQGDDCDKVKESINQIATVSPHSLSSHRPFPPFMGDGHYPDGMGYNMPYSPYKGQNYPDGRFRDIVSPYPTRYLHEQPQQSMAPRLPAFQHPNDQQRYDYQHRQDYHQQQDHQQRQDHQYRQDHQQWPEYQQRQDHQPWPENQPRQDNQPREDHQSRQENQPRQDNQPRQENQSRQDNKPRQDNQPRHDNKPQQEQPQRQHQQQPQQPQRQDQQQRHDQQLLKD